MMISLTTCSCSIMTGCLLTNQKSGRVLYKLATPSIICHYTSLLHYCVFHYFQDFYTMTFHNGSYTPVEIGLTELPSTVECVTIDLPDLPSDTSEVLLYLFVTSKTAVNPWRGYYEIFTKDAAGTEYKQYLNVAFMKDDFTLNSANIWLPIFNERKFYVRIPNKYDPPALLTRKSHEPKLKFDTIEDILPALKNPSAMVSYSFLTGYRLLNQTRK